MRVASADTQNRLSYSALVTKRRESHDATVARIDRRMAHLLFFLKSIRFEGF